VNVNKILKRRAFSLIELLIVIVLIGVIYTFALQGLDKVKEEKFSLTLVTLKEYLKSFIYENNVKLLCLERCERCYIYIDEKRDKNTIENFLNENVKIYRYEFSYGYVEDKPDVYFNENGAEEDVCFSYEIDKIGIGNQILVEYEGDFYDFSQYFKKTLKYDNLESAQEAKENQLRDVLK